MLKARRDLGSRIGKHLAQSTLHGPYAAVDGISGGPRFLAGLEANVVQKGRAGESLFGDGVGLVNVRPPANEVQQIQCIAAQRVPGQAPDATLVQIAGDPVYLTAGLLNDHAERTLRVVRSGLMNHGVDHECALCNKSRNCRASPPPLTKKLFGLCNDTSST